MSKQKNEIGMESCPVCRFFSNFEKISMLKPKLFGHLNQSGIEFLKAINSLIDDRIESMEKKGSPKAKKKMSKIKVN